MSVALRDASMMPLSREEKIKVCACLAVPRLGFNDFWGCVQHALMPFTIPIRTYTGCFWSQQMQTALEGVVEDGNDWALCLDYDTTFTREHVKQLLQCTQLYPYADAIAALQRKRNNRNPIMSVPGKANGHLERGMMEAETAHFGFTLIRCGALRELPKPWLLEQPSPTGQWGEGATYPDEYFWNQWRAAGNSLYVNTDIRVGHIENVVSDYDENLEPRQMFVGDWMRSHTSVPQRVTV